MSGNWIVQNIENALDTWNSKLSEKLHNNPLISTSVIQYSIMKELIREEKIHI